MFYTSEFFDLMKTFDLSSIVGEQESFIVFTRGRALLGPLVECVDLNLCPYCTMT